MDTSPANAMGGCRLNPLGLHLGHHLGCFSHIKNLGFDQYFFVIRDIEWIGSVDKALFVSSIINMTKDALAAMPIGIDCFVVRQSFLQQEAKKLSLCLQNNLTATQLFNTHAIWRKLKVGQTNGITTSNLLFPLDSFLSYAALQARFICMNDDNARFVESGARLIRKILRKSATMPLQIPELHSGSIPKILGHNYSKMAFGADNYLLLNSNPIEIDNYVEKLFRKSYFFRKFPEKLRQYEHEVGHFVMPDEFLPYTYSSIFSSEPFPSFSASEIPVYRDKLRQMSHEFFHLFHDRRAKISETAARAALASGQQNAAILIAKIENFLSEQSF
jgi:tryptophanyl-tRNA synthetase